MPNEPSIKGMAIAGLVEDLGALLRADPSGEAELTKGLDDADRALLEDGFDPFAWYPVGTYERLIAALVAAEGLGAGDSHVEFLRERGANAARRLMEKGLYQQLESLRRGHEWTRQDHVSRVRLVATLHGSMLSFSSWSVDEDPDHPDRARIVISDARDFPEVLRTTVEGFVNVCAETVRGGARWHSERVEPDRIVYRMDGDFAR